MNAVVGNGTMRPFSSGSCSKDSNEHHIHIDLNNCNFYSVIKSSCTPSAILWQKRSVSKQTDNISLPIFFQVNLGSL